MMNNYTKAIKVENKLKGLAMDKHEAEKILLKEFAPYLKKSYKEFLTLAGKENVKKIKGESGTEYFWEIYVGKSNSPSDYLEIESYIHEANTKKRFPPNVYAAFYISPDNIIKNKTELLNGLENR